MSWDCPHQKKDECVRLKKVCRPLQKDCILEGKVQYIDDQLNKREEKDFKRYVNQKL